MREYNQTSLLSSACRAKALEDKLLTKEKFERICDASDFSEIERILSDAGYGGLDEKALSDMLCETYGIFSEMLKDFPEAADVLKYQYDCHNIKSCIKCLFCDRNPEELMIDVGTIPASKVIEYVKVKNFGDFPVNMGIAANNAIEAYAIAPNPQSIDTIMDSACYKDMLEAAKNCGFDFPYDFVQTEIDITDICIAMRSYAMKWDAYKTSKFFISGGKIDLYNYEKWGSKENFIAKYKYSIYGSILDEIAENDIVKPSEIERICKKYEYNFIKNTAFTNDSCAAVYSYVLKRENEIKNIRIALSGRKAGKSAQSIMSELSLGLL